MIKILCRIRALRKEKNLTQEELADKLGISRQSIISVESGKSTPSLPLALQIAGLFNRNIEEIFESGCDNQQRVFGLERFFDEEWPEMEAQHPVGIPAVNVYEKEDNVIIEAQVPGIDPENVEISVSDDVLKISGERKEEKEEKDKNFYRREMSIGSFSRSVQLPTKVKYEAAEAEYTNGILKITLPKLDEKIAKSVKLKIKKKN